MLPIHRRILYLNVPQSTGYYNGPTNQECHKFNPEAFSYHKVPVPIHLRENFNRGIPTFVSRPNLRNNISSQGQLLYTLWTDHLSLPDESTCSLAQRGFGYRNYVNFLFISSNSREGHAVCSQTYALYSVGIAQSFLIF